MTRHQIFVLVALTAGIGAIVLGLFMWSPHENKEVIVKPAVMIEEKTAPENVAAGNSGGKGDDLMDDRVTRIIIENGSDQADKINDILSDKVIVNDEVKDIHSLSEWDNKREQ